MNEAVTPSPASPTDVVAKMREVLSRQHAVFLADGEIRLRAASAVSCINRVINRVGVGPLETYEQAVPDGMSAAGQQCPQVANPVQYEPMLGRLK